MKDALGHGSDPRGTHSEGIQAAVPTPFEAATKIRDALAAEGSRISAELNKYPKGPMGLTPDHIKATPEWKSLKAKSDAHFQRTRAFNAKYVKAFDKEIRAERDARRVSRMSR